MALSLDWENRIINIPRVDMALIQSTPTEIREQSLVNLFALLREQEATGTGMIYPPILTYSKPVSVGGVTLAPVVSIINGYTITFEDGQYAVNLVGANSNVADNVNVNQVSVRSANSAGLVQTREIEQAAFEGRVCIDATKLDSGTAYPMGTLGSPVNNLADALFIAALRDLDTFYVIGSFTIGATDIISNYTFTGRGVENTKLTLTQGCTTMRTTFRDMTVNGWQDGETHYYGCEIKALSGVHCKFEDCLLVGPMVMEEGTFVDTTVLINCYTGWDKNSLAVKDEFVVDMTNSSVNMAFNGFNGKVKFTNLAAGATNTPGTVLMNIVAGKVTVDSTCTGGTIKLRGNYESVNNANGTTVDDDSTANLVWQYPSAVTIVNQLAEAWGRLGLDPSKPLVTGQTSITFGDIILAMTGNETATTVTRQ